MHFHFSFYSSILLIFFTQGIIFSFLLLKKGLLQNRKECLWLSAFVCTCSLYILPWMLGFAGWYSLQPYRDIMFYIPFQQLLLVGPVIYCYTQSLLNPYFTFNKKVAVHFIVPAIYLLYRIVIFIGDKLLLQTNFFYTNPHDKSLDIWYQLAGIASMAFYFIASIRYYNLYQKLIVQIISYADAVLFSWVKKYLLVFLLMLSLRLLFYFLYPNWGSFKEQWWYYLSFSCLFYYIAITGYTNNVRAVISFRVTGEFANPVYWLMPTLPSDEKVTEIKLLPLGQETKANAQDPEIDNWKQKIELLMEQEQLYKNPTLTLQDVATHLHTNQTIVSKMVNQGFGISFNDLINNYRVQAVKQLLQSGEHKRQTLLGISIDCGFNSKTSFNRSFKKVTGLSPKEFIKNDIPSLQ
jgi:AraC-like DNA-binding protein